MAKKKSVSKKNKNKKVTLGSLKNWNFAVAAFLALQSAALLVLSNSTSVPVTTTYLTKNSLASEAAGQTMLAPAVRHLFDVRLSYILAAILLIGAIAYGLNATLNRKRYEADLKQNTNRSRWLEYTLGGGLMLIAISLVNGVYDFSTLLAIFALTEIAVLFAYLVESRSEISQRHPRVVNKISFVAVITPWLVVSIYLFGSILFGTDAPPTYLYWLDALLFVLFMKKPINMWLYGHKKGRWADYLFAERGYMLIDFATKTALVWIIFGNLLQK